jgi:hypothetical protein
MPYSTLAQRRALRDELVAAYNPACQSTADATLKPRRTIGFAPEFAPATGNGS